MPEVALIDAAASPNVQSSEEEDEKFVPTRIILPVCSLGLAIAAGPLALPPLAVGVFIIGAAHLSFKRAWEGLKKERKINVDFLDALAVLLHSLEGFLLGPAMMITMIEEAVRDATQRIAHSSNTVSFQVFNLMFVFSRKMARRSSSFDLTRVIEFHSCQGIKFQLMALLNLERPLLMLSS